MALRGGLPANMPVSLHLSLAVPIVGEDFLDGDLLRVDSTEFQLGRATDSVARILPIP